MGDPTTRPDYGTVFETLALSLEDTVGLDAGETLAGSPDDWRDTMRSSLPRLPLGDDESAQFQIASVLGQGGMGIVHLAYQSALGRHVAIKTVPSDRTSRDAENALLQEARIMGLVEHPNVVPVHIIGQDDSGRPVIVMKRIDGTAWSDYLDGDASPDTDDELGFHLKIVQAVCRAVSLAHDRHILHRDIKPENVMVGRFGEVYVLDWGLAVTMADNVPYVPSAGKSDDIVGTPAFMAPEMTIGEGNALGVHTDIFLIGATLYHVVTGKPPNQGESLFDVLACSYEGRPRSYPPSVPSELRDICERAMAYEPEDRYPSAEALREAIDAFLSHRSSYNLAETALERTAQLERQCEEGDAELDELHQVFGEARFGFLSALQIWPDNGDARSGLDHLLRLMIDVELQQENIKGARSLAVQLSAPDDAVMERIDALAEQLGARAAKLEKLARDYDESIGLRAKRWVVGLLALLFVVPPFIHRAAPIATVPSALQQLTTDPDALVASIWGFVFAPFLAVWVVITGRRFQDHKSSRVFAKGLFIMFVVGFTMRLSMLWADMPLHLGMAAEAAVYASSLMMLGLAIDRRLFTPGLIYAATALGAGHMADMSIDIFCGGSFLACLAFIFFRPNISAD